MILNMWVADTGPIFTTKRNSYSFYQFRISGFVPRVHTTVILDERIALMLSPERIPISPISHSECSLQ
jgi:hypothetical protein